MKIGKQIRQRGKIQLSEYFKDLKNGDNVALVAEASIPSSYPKRIMGKTGKIIGERGMSKIVSLLDGGKRKTFIIHPIHLKLLKITKNKEKK